MRILQESRTVLAVETSTKLNVFLEVLGRRDDGFHELESLFVELEAPSDVVIVERRPRRADDPPSRVTSNDPALADDPSNLCARALAAFLEEGEPAPGEALAVHLDKRVPLGSGLAGGSADGAATLLALARLHPERGLPHARGTTALASPLLGLAQRLGSDVPFFLCGGTAHVRGRGERVAPCAFEFPGAFALALSGIHCATPEVFRALGPPSASPRPVAPLTTALERGATAALDACFWNRLAAPCYALHPALRELADALAQLWGRGVHVSGSGSTLFAWFEERTQAERAVDAARVRHESVRFLCTAARAKEARW